jgi:hypothetical protein
MRTALALLLLLITSAFAADEPPNPMERTIRQFGADWGGVSRFYDLPWSELRMDRLEKLRGEWERRAQELDYEALDSNGRIDALLLMADLRHEVSQLKLLRKRLEEMDELLPFREVILSLETNRWRSEALDPQAMAAKLDPLPREIKDLRKEIEAAQKKKKSDDSEKEEHGLAVLPVVAKRAAGAVNDFRETLKKWFTFHDGYQPDFSWWVKKPYDETMSALEDFAKFLREEVARLKGKDDDPLIGDPIGKEAIEADLRAQFIGYSPEELIRIGERELAWCEEQMRATAKEMGFSDWKEALAKVKARYEPPGKQDDLVVQQAGEAIDFLKQHKLVTIPALCEETWRLRMISPDGQKNLPYAAYGGQSIMVAYPREEMKHEDKMMAMRGNNRHFTRIVTAHELIPGHHLQAFQSERFATYRSIFSTPFFVEGWAVYWELKLWDRNYAQSPEDKIGMLFWRMHRCARIIVSLKFHLGEMSPKEMVGFLVDRVGHEHFGAESEVRRYIGEGYSPLYQCSYMIGALQLRALHEEVVGKGKMKEREFNDALLTFGAIPIEMVRAGILKLKLPRDYEPKWRFAD